MKRGVFSGIQGLGRRFHSGIEGSLATECAAAASGKLSSIGKLLLRVTGLYFFICPGVAEEKSDEERARYRKWYVVNDIKNKDTVNKNIYRVP